MKKFYTLALTAVLAFSATANVDLEPAQVRTSPFVEKQLTVENTEAALKAIQLSSNQDKPAKTAVAKDFSNIDGVCGIYNWTYYDYFDKANASAQIKIEKTENENEVAISGMYNSYIVYATFDAASQTLNFPKNQAVASTVVFSLGTLSGSTITFVETAATLDSENGTISFDPAIYLGFRTTNGWYMLTNQNAFVAIDENKLISVTSDQCTGDNKFKITVKPGSAVAKVKCSIFKGFYTATDANVNVVATKGGDTQGNNLIYNGAGQDKGCRTVMVAALDADGNTLSGDACYLYVNDYDNTNWKDVEGKAMYTDAYIASVYGVATDDYELSVQVNTATKGYYRLVNPYGSAYPLADQNAHDADSHPHYLYIHAEDPAKVWIEESPMGFEVKTGVMVATSYVSLYKSRGREESTYEQYYGTLDTESRTISFPEKALLLQELSDKEGNLYYANKNSEFSLTLPESVFAGVDDIEIDQTDAPVEYFNLQGVRVENPENGLFIRRQGDKVEKVVVR